MTSILIVQDNSPESPFGDDQKLYVVAETLCLIPRSLAEHGRSEFRTLERTDTHAWRPASRHPLPNSPIGRNATVHTNQRLGASTFHRSGCLGANPTGIGRVLQQILRQARPLRIGRLPPSLHWWSQQAWRVISRRYGYRSSDCCPNTISARRRRLPLRSLALHRRTYHSYLRHRILSPRHCHAPRGHRSACSPRSALVPLDGHPRRTTSARLLLLVRHRQHCGSNLLSRLSRMGLRA